MSYKTVNLSAYCVLAQEPNLYFYSHFYEYQQVPNNQFIQLSNATCFLVETS